MQLGQFRCDNFACDRQKLKHECPRNALIGRATHGNAIHAQCDAVQTFYHCWIVRVGGKSKLPGLDIDMVVTTMFALGYAIVNAEGSKWKFLDMGNCNAGEDRKSTRLTSSHQCASRMQSSA